MIRGYFGIGCYGMKTSFNYGTLFRSAKILGADFIFLINTRFKVQSSDTVKSHNHLPLYQYENFKQFNDNRPYGAELVGIELDEKSKPISEFVHPQKAIYLLGAEDTGLPKEVINQCQHLIQLPGEFSLNVSVAGSIVLFDRINKLIKP